MMINQAQKKNRTHIGGCEEAQLLVGYRVSCIEGCPFSECLDYLTPWQRLGVVRILRQRDIILKSYNLIDAGNIPSEAARITKCPLGTTYTWISKREQYERLFAGDISGLFNGNGKVNE